MEKGTFEGQLVTEESFVHPVDPFTIETDDDVFLELQFEADTLQCKSEIFAHLSFLKAALHSHLPPPPNPI